MLYFLIILALAFILGLFAFIFELRKKIDLQDKGEKMAVILDRLEKLSFENRELRQMMDSKLSEAHLTTRDQMNQTMRAAQGIASQSVKSISEITEKLTKLEETNKQVVNFSAQLQNLQDILKNPKQRGILGEFYLEEILKNVLPPDSYQMQYKLGKSESGGDLIVDAVVFVQKKIIPIDSKFSLENYEKILNSREDSERAVFEKSFKQDLKNRIDETAKYIKPGEGTMDFAFMFIPSEAIYYDLLVNKVGAVKVNTTDLIQYAIREKKVIIVSPTSFHAYLQTVLQGLRALQIEEGAKQIKVNVEKLGRHLLTFDDFMKKLHNSLGTTVNHFNSAYKEFGKVDKDVAKITGGEKNIEALVLEKPKLD